MGYRGGSLVHLVSEETTAAPTRHLLRDVADEAGTAMTVLAKANTPKDTGRTADSFEQVPVQATIERLERGYTAGVQSS